MDKQSIAMFEANLEQNLLALMRDLKSGVFQPLPVRRVFIPKGQGQSRPLGIPAVRDRVAQEVLRLLLSPLFERVFHEDSFGFRPGRNCHMAVTRVLELHEQGFQHVLDADILGFFENIPHAVIMAGVASEVADGNILDLLERFLKAGVMEQGVLRPTRVGTPQGGVISPLLANIALNSLDWHLDQHGMRFVRYADDFVVLCPTEAAVQEALDLVQQHLASLSLQLSAGKTKVSPFREGFDFLGFAISSWRVTMRAKSVENFKNKIRDLTPRRFNLEAKVIEKLNRVIRGTANYFATTFSAWRTMFRGLDRWIRMRIRCMKYKRKSMADNGRLRLKNFRHMQLLFLTELGPAPV
jgi:group II intron reverse transcriptase/maturase